MPKDNKCESKQPCNPPSDNSEVCYKVKCEPKCEKNCCIKQCPCYKPEELVCLYKDAVVELHSEFILTTSNGPDAPGPLGTGTRADVILEGNGFFIKGHYIVAPAHLVLLPPSLTSVVNRYPYFDPQDLSSSEDTPSIQDKCVRASRILVSVFNVNGKGHSFVYEADLVGVDGAGDIAVLKINYKKQWNLCNPCVEKCHPYFKFGHSRGSKDGEKIYLIGDFIGEAAERKPFNSVGAIVEGLLADHRHIDYSGWVLAETVLVSAPAYASSSGLPIINCQGQVIGMQTTDLSAIYPGGTGGNQPRISDVQLQRDGSGYVAGPSEFFMRRIIKSIIQGTCSRKYNCQLEVICDPVGSYYRYKKAYLGLAYNVFTGIDYDVTVDYTSGAAPRGSPRVRLDSNGNFLNSPSCKELIGIKVIGLAGANPNDAIDIPNGYWFVPGGTASAPLADGLPISSLLGRLEPGDVITHINGVALGDLEKQIPPSLILWRLCKGDQIELCYRKGGNASNDEPTNDITDNYDNLLSTTVCLQDFPCLLDYPWYAVNKFPLISGDISFYPAFSFPGNQSHYPQYPSLQYAPSENLNNGQFHAAL
jgi:hypothetical protein